MNDDLGLSALAPGIAAFHAYWNGKRRGRTTPSRADLDAIEMARLAQVAAVECVSASAHLAPERARRIVAAAVSKEAVNAHSVA